MHPSEADPHSFFAQLREDGPVHRIPCGPDSHAWLVTRYEDAKRALNDQRLAKGPLVQHRMGGPITTDVHNATSMHMLNADPPDHSRLRRLVSAAFTARRMESIRPRVQEISDSLIGSFANWGEADLIDDYAFPLPFQVICELIGVPMVDREAFRGWSNTMLAHVAEPLPGSARASRQECGQPGSARASRQECGQPESIAAINFLTAYVRELVARKRSEPDDALLSGLIDASDAGDRLNEDELTSAVFLLLIAGHETTVNLIGNAMYLLLQRPDQAEALRENPSLLSSAIEEVLRYESPVKNATFRITVEPVSFDDVVLPAGELVLISLLSANHDESVFTKADELDLSRQDGQHLAFGHGIHYCLGAPLARIEGQIAISSLLNRFPDMRPATPLSQLDWRPGLLLRGLSHLPVRLH